MEAFELWFNKQHGIMPNQYHHFYEQGETLIYPEHVADLIKIDQMYKIRLKKEYEEEQRKSKAKQNKLSPQQQGANFYGRKFAYDKDGNVK